MDAVDQQELATALTEVSKSFAAHGRWAKHLLDAFERSPKLFMTEFLPQIYRLLLIFKRCASVERVVQFVCRLAVEPTTNPRLNGKMAFVIVQKLLGFHSAKDKAVRFRVCQIIGVILSKMTDGTELSDELLDEIQSTMLLRIKDKVAAVRAMSCLCLARLQDPTNLDDDVVSAIIFAAEHDSSNIVRKSALANLGVSKATLPYILARIKDTCADVRLAALKVCSEKLAMKALSISQRTTLLYAAITDRDNEVKKACEELLIPTWLAQCDNSIFVFLSCLDVQEFEKESERIAAFCVSHQISKDMCSDWKLETDADLSPEKALVWRVYAEQLRKQKKFDIIESAFPVPVEFADTLRAHHTNTFVTSQLLKVFTVIEIDEVGRSVLTNLFLEWLRSSETDVLLIPSIMKALYRILVHRQSVVTGESEFTTNTLLVLADLRDPLEEIGPNDDQRKQQEAEMEQRYEDLKQQLEEAQALKTEYIRLEDFGGASEQKKLISEIEKEMQDIDDVLTAKETVEHAKWQRLIAVTSSLLQHVRRTPFSSLHDLCESTIHPAIIHESELIREPALRCLCLYSLLDAETARSNLTIFTKAIYNDVPSVQLTSIKSCFDLLMVHDLCQDADVRESVIGVLVEFLSSEDSELRTTAVKGFAKLLFNDRISNVNILCTLIILLFNPTTEDDVELRQTLSLFFPLYCEESHTHRSSLGEAILPACRIFINAPHQSPLRKVASSQVAPFVLFLVGNDPNDIGSLAFDLVAELLSNTSNPAHVRFLSHMLSLVPLDAVTGTQIKVMGRNRSSMIRCLSRVVQN
ncbi:hypothetical protein PBRA_000769 [Plasmodiophora brassicae]|uniref:Nuclear condensin complex subunit 3 C-terminal domain-containing protein n=1 Tax=Plasmodiophora brassicae TaxID=37360 RepID=A0A0G4IQI3_PLABS|nr:hypothetical protein PBRA_000769 [Plasmodiophora brassicae]